jgi:signal transduction histidine kinase
MASSRVKSSLPVFILGIFALGWALAGFLVYRWINRVSVADRAQQHHLLWATMRSFRGDFVGTLFEIRSTFRPAPRVRTTEGLNAYLSAFYSQWRSTDANAPLIDGISVAEIGANGQPQFARFDSKSGQFRPQPWPASLATFQERLKKIPPLRHFPLAFIFAGVPFALDGDRPVVVIPLMEPLRQNGGTVPSSAVQKSGNTFFLSRGGGVPAKGGGRAETMRYVVTEHIGRAALRIHLTGWCFLELDTHYLEGEFLPRLVERTFERNGLSDYRVAVVTGKPPQMIYRTDPSQTVESTLAPDAALALFTPNEELGPRFARLLTQAGPSALPSRGPRLPSIRPPAPERIGLERPQEILQRSSGAWVLVAQNKAGSIEALVARSRRRNLLMGFGALFLLAWSMGSLLVTTRRSRELAHREMEFVAGVSHEFRTPLASIQSAGYNLASGIVREPSRVEQYGSLVQKEARRLADTVEQVLSYAGIQSGRESRKAVPTGASGVIDQALAEYLPVFNQKGWVVEKQVRGNMPPVLAEPASLESAIKNLLANALKYAAEGKWIGIRAQTAANGKNPEVQISVEDHGPGIASSDLPHIFEPFYRGKQVLASSVPGTGLGLSILKRHLEAHGGRVTVESAKGKGAKFILHLPVVPDGPGDAA